MKTDTIDWDEELDADPEEQYSSFLRALRRKEGFGILFVRCSPAEGEKAIARAREDLPQKSIEVLSLEEPIKKFYQRVEELPNREEIDILFVRGLEKSFYDYEERKRQEGWESKDIYSYSLKGVPPVLVNINQQRERFRDNFRFVLVFLLPVFGIDYFINRAPDFFDWRSGLFELYDFAEVLPNLLGSSTGLSKEKRKEKLLEIETLLKDSRHSLKEKADLLSGQGLLLFIEKRYEEAVISYDKALEIAPNFYKPWEIRNFLNFRGQALENLGRYEEALESYNKAQGIEQSSHNCAAIGRILNQLGRYEEAVKSKKNIYKN